MGRNLEADPSSWWVAQILSLQEALLTINFWDKGDIRKSRQKLTGNNQHHFPKTES